MDDLHRWAQGTWRSLLAATCSTGLPADSVGADLHPGSRALHTSPTNIAGLLWSLVAARALHLERECDAVDLGRRVLETLQRMRVHHDSGMFYNWYDASSGAPIDEWPTTGDEIEPFVSSVDNGWLAAALMLVAQQWPALRSAAQELLARMDFGVFHDAEASPRAGLIHGGFWQKQPAVPARQTEHLPGTVPVWSTLHHYDLLCSEPRIAVYVGILRGQIPAEAYTALAAPVRTYRGREVVVSLGGSMFEALSPDMFVPEEVWAPHTWGRNHAATVACQREYGLQEKAYGSWGFSPCARPSGGYQEFGVAPISWLRTGYPSEADGEGVVTPHALLMALQYEPDAAIEALTHLETDLQCTGAGGFIDAVGVRTGRRAQRHLTLDQAFGMAALANHLADDVMRAAFASPDVGGHLRAVVAARPWPSAIEDVPSVCQP